MGTGTGGSATRRTPSLQGEAEKSWLRLTAEDAKSSNQGKPGGRRGGSNRSDTAVDECKNEMVNRVARYQFD